MATRLVVEWTRASLRLAVARGGGARSRLVAVHSRPLGSPDEVAEALRALLKTARSSGTQVIGVVSREQVITRVVKFPTAEARELAQMVELYAKAQLPYPRGQIETDFHVLQQQGGFTTVAIVACQRDVIGRDLALLRQAGLSPSLLTVSSWGVLGWYRRLIRVTPSQEPALVVNVDDTRTDLVLIAHGAILSSRSIAQGVADWKGATEVTDLLTLEVERSRAAIRKELPGVEVRALILTGLGEIDQWKEPLSQRLGLPVQVVEARVPGKPVKRGKAPPAALISPVVVAGLACSELQGLLNLSPSEVRESVHHRRQVRELVAVSVLLLGVLLCGSALLAVQADRQRHVAAQLDAAIVTVEPSARKLHEQSRLARMVGSVLADRRRFATTLAGVFLKTPADVSLEGLTFERAKREMELRGSGTSNQAVLEYVAALKQVEGIDTVQLKYSTRRATPGGERTDFKLVLK